MCLADVTMRKLKIHQTLLALPLLKNGHRHGKAFPTLKFIENEQKLWYLKGKKAFCTEKNVNLDELILNFGEKVFISHFNTVLGKFSCGTKVSYGISSNSFFAF